MIWALLVWLVTQNPAVDTPVIKMTGFHDERSCEVIGRGFVEEYKGTYDFVYECVPVEKNTYTID
jgi:hypothetical protein